MASSESLALYEDLPSDDNIRLLEILPGTDSVVECLLHVGYLHENKHTYEALSYTWDQDYSPTTKDRDVAIRCNGVNVSIGGNLASALKRLRNVETSRLIWADALCINQQDNRERSHQVMRMNLIYENALRVVIWLGEEHPTEPYAPAPPVHLRESYKAFSGVCAVVNTWRKTTGNEDVVPRAIHLPIVSTSKMSDTSEVLSPKSEIWRSIFVFYERRWFHRLWPIQEVALARTATVIWDECEIAWEWVGQAAAIIRTNYDRISALIRDPSIGRRRAAPSRRVPGGVSNAYFLYRLSRSQTRSTPLQFTFAEILKLTRGFGCKDPRDRVYGLLSLPMVDNIKKSIFPDYEKTTDEVYIDIARKILESSSSLSLLSSVQRDSANLVMKPWNPYAQHYNPKMPSWVPQWSFLLTQTINPSHPSASFAASQGRPAQIHPSPNPLELLVRGIVVDRVASCVYQSFQDFWRGANVADRANGWDFWGQRALDDHPKPLQNALEQCQRTKKDLEKIALTLTAGQNWYGVPVHDVSAHLADYARCLVKDGLVWSVQMGAAPPPPQQEKPQISGERSSNVPSEYVQYDELEALAQNGNPDRFLDAAATASARRARFTTDGGLFGVGPEAMKKGDYLCVFYGAAVPFIIRPTKKEVEATADDTVQPTAKMGRLMGECYVHDLMHGEAVEQLNSEASKACLKESWIRLV
jgi:hypothetical protein